ncbi:hypothetical protein CHU93_02850 [Sandarakinorhabdus cyanobacteriorum]|uniref:Cholesterol oxidase n=1 Tax=Sandarakinorhabdus cyanobacteriorum TaxID=1981098 RepID=A0A255YYZ2_9SPHN|nr:GMC family oxidoreductase N-terminal domain-containing protein [Sandarakinorhabdus cyanobacteriorum]OYQ33875.1 hypothetical protein CHU93_02850 [Sandarakinorhabdus cyanobacteriorum]
MIGTLIARPLTDIAERYDVVVIGSGYGAAVAASRLARAGRRVAVLERGREIRPGQFPDTLAKASAEMQIDTSRGKLGVADGLYNLHVNPDMFALVGCGLGGTSLINANVALELHETRIDEFPAALRDDALGPHFARAREWLDARPYPEGAPPLGKLKALEQSARMMGQPFYRPPIAVNFTDQINPQGVPQPACNNCGDCCSGCNVGAKNTLLMNYLPDAANHGASIFTRARVTHISPADAGGWLVHFEPCGDGAPGQPGAVQAALVVLGAGALGSTEIMLRSAEQGLPLSARVGQGFSGNGDVLAFGYDSYAADPAASADQPANVNAIGVGTNQVPADQYPGPCIAGIIDMRDEASTGGNPLNAMVIEEGVIPGALAAVMPAAFFFGNALVGSFTQFGLDEAKPRLLSAQGLGTALQNDPMALASWSYKGQMARTQTYLTMSVDMAQGELALHNDRLAIAWPGAGREPSIERDNRKIREAATAIKGQFLPNPLWTEPMGKKLVTVHPVGGCRMAEAAELGVVNWKGQVFTGRDSTSVHDGLYICCGAVMPAALGVNPLLTITAFAEHVAAQIAADHGWTIDWSRQPARRLPPPPPAPPSPDPAEPAGNGVLDWLRHLGKALEDGAIDAAKTILKDVIKDHPDLLSPSFQFTETMSGWVSRHDVRHPGPADQRISDDYAVAAAWGQSRGHGMAFRLTIEAESLYQLATDPMHPGTISGEVSCPELAAEPMPVRHGTFNLLFADPDHPEQWLMTYDMVLARPEGPCRFRGFKTLRQRAGSDAWTDVTTLFITVHDGEDGSGKLLSQGILKLDIEDLMWQASSAKLLPKNLISDVVDEVEAARSAIDLYYLAKLGAFFAITLFRAYGGVLSDLENFIAQDRTGPERPHRALALPAPISIAYDLGDGFSNRLTRYQGGSKGPVIVAPGFSIRAASYALDTVDHNFAEALVAAGYDVWLFDYRASPDSGTAGTPPFTIDDIARVDWPAAVARVQQETGKADVQVVAHCISCVSLMMALAAGLKGVRHLVASQFTMHPISNWFNYVKADLGVAQLLSGVSQLKGSFNFQPGDSLDDRVIDFAAWNLPVPDGEECNNPACRRVFAVYGPSYAHAQLNRWTHTCISDWFGPVSIKPFEQLQLMLRAGKAVNAEGKNIYVTPEGARNLALPISFLAGASSQIFYPETAQRTRRWLSDINGPGLYTMKMIKGYAHMDLFIGKTAAADVFPWIIAELDRHQTGTPS